MFQLRFNQKLSLGSGLVLLIILVFGLLFLAELNALNKSATRFNDAAITLSKKAHSAEVQLLTLAKFSSLASTAPDKDSVLTNKQRFERDSASYMAKFRELISLSSKDENINVLVIAVSTNYDLYRYSVREMFDAQLHYLDAQAQGKDLALAERARLRSAIKNKLNESDAAAIQAINGFEELSDYLDQRHQIYQDELFSGLEFGFKSAVAALVIAILLAAQIFNLLRLAIQAQRRDSVTLNTVSGKLAYSQSHSMALEELLGCLHEQIGVTQGSVYLMNDANKLEVNAHFPPKRVSHSNKAALFEIGEGLIGKAALSKKIIYVPNTAKDKVFVERGNLQNANAVGKDLFSDEIVYKERALVCVPLLDKDLLVGVLNLSGEPDKVQLQDSDYEFVAALAHALVTAIKNIRAREVLEERYHALDAQLSNSFEQIDEAHRSFGHMLESLPIGLFSVGRNGLVHEDYASVLEDILETDQIAGRSFADLLFSHVNNDSRLIDQNISAVHAILGAEFSEYRSHAGYLMDRLNLQLAGGHEKSLAVTWEPMLSAEGTIDKLIVCLSDRSDNEQLNSQLQDHKRQLDVLVELMACESESLSEFLELAQASLKANRDLILANRKKDLNVITHLYSQFTMLKNRARSLGINQFGQLMQEFEASYGELIRNETLAWRVDSLLLELEQASNLLAIYVNFSNANAQLSA